MLPQHRADAHCTQTRVSFVMSSGLLKFGTIQPVWVKSTFNFPTPPRSIFHHFLPHIGAGVPPLPPSLSFTLFTSLCLTLDYPLVSLSSLHFLSLIHLCVSRLFQPLGCWSSGNRCMPPPPLQFLTEARPDTDWPDKTSFLAQSLFLSSPIPLY